MYGKSPFLMGKLTISMAIFNSFLYVYQSANPPLSCFMTCGGLQGGHEVVHPASESEAIPKPDNIRITPTNRITMNHLDVR